MDRDSFFGMFGDDDWWKKAGSWSPSNEEPVSEENISELITLKKQTNLSLATGERLYTKFPFVKLVEDNAVDVLQPDIANAGGLTELKKISIIAEGKHNLCQNFSV